MLFQSEDGIRYLVRSRGLGDVYKRQAEYWDFTHRIFEFGAAGTEGEGPNMILDDGGDATLLMILGKRAEKDISVIAKPTSCLLYTSDAADERSSVDLGGRRIIKKQKTKQKKQKQTHTHHNTRP